MKLNILLISYNFHTSLSPRAIKWQKIIHEWSKQNNVEVISGDKNTNQGRSSSFLTRMPILVSILRHFRWPDYAMIWMLRSLIILMKKDLSQVDKMVSSSHPFSSHMLGLLLKIRKRDLHWTMDVGDPFFLGSTMKVNSIWLTPLSKYFEKKCISLADRITVNTEALRSVYINGYGVSRDKILLVPPVTDVYPTAIKKPVGFRLVYAGRFYPNERPLSDLLDVLRVFVNTFHDVSLDIYGPIDGGYDSIVELKGLSENVFFKGFSSQDDLRDSMKYYDYYLNMGNKNNVQLPSKNIDLLTFGIPVLYLEQNSSDPFVEATKDIKFICSISKGLTEGQLRGHTSAISQLFDSQDGCQLALSLAQAYVEPSLAKNQKQYYE
jgi:glycosyltransferase involved in cell wall biosynthesis